MGFYVGIDGGGTGSRFSCADEKGNILFAGEGGALNGNGLSKAAQTENIEKIINEINANVGKPEDCTCVAIGAAGISNTLTRDVFISAFNNAGFGNIRLYGDYETAFATAFPEGSGILLISGTGSMCYGKRDDGIVARSGGYGHIIDDRGSAYDIATKMLEAIVRAEDGRGEKTLLKELVFKELGITKIEELITFIYSQDTTKGKLAALSPLLSKALEAGDEVSVRICRYAAKELNALVEAVVSNLKLDCEVALWGSVLRKNNYVRKALEECTSHRLFLPDEDASVGALRHAMKKS